MLPSSSSSTLYRSVDSQIGGDDVPNYPHPSELLFRSHASADRIATGAELVDSELRQVERSSQTMNSAFESLGTSNQIPEQPTLVSGRLFSLPSYLHDEALQNRLKEEGIVEEEPTKHVFERRVVSTSVCFAGNSRGGQATSPKPGRAGDNLETAEEEEEDKEANSSSESFHSTFSHVTVLDHGDQPSVHLVPPAAASVDGSSEGSTPDSVVIITPSDSEIIHPLSFLRSRAPTPPPSTAQAPANTADPDSAKSVTVSQSDVSRHAESEDLPEMMTPGSPTHSQSGEEDTVSEEEGWVTGHPEKGQDPPTTRPDMKKSYSEEEGWIVNADSAPRPIPALHGPLSLPYARCPSGAEGEIFYNSQSVRDLVWDMDAQSLSREPPYLHPDYAAIVDYKEQCSAKEPSNVIVLMDSALPNQSSRHARGRSRTLPLLNTGIARAPSSDTSSPTETRRANEWRAQPAGTRYGPRKRQDYHAEETAAASSPEFGVTMDSNTMLPTSHSNSSLGSWASYSTAEHPATINEYENVIPHVHINFPTTHVPDSQILLDERVCQMLFEREQRRLFEEEQNLQIALAERVRKMSLTSSADGQGYGEAHQHYVESPLSYGHVLPSLEDPITSWGWPSDKDFQNITAATSQDPRNAWHQSSQSSELFPSLMGYDIPLPVPPSRSNSDPEHLHPSNRTYQPRAPDGSAPFKGYPNVSPMDTKATFSASSPFTPSTVPSYANPLTQMQHLWEGTPNAIRPAASVYYADTSVASVMGDDEKDTRYDMPTFQSSPTTMQPHTTALHSTDFRRRRVPSTPNASQHAWYSGQLEPPSTVHVGNLQPTYRISKQVVHVADGRRGDCGSTAVNLPINDLDPPPSLLARPNARLDLPFARGHRISSANPLDISLSTASWMPSAPTLPKPSSVNRDQQSSMMTAENPWKGDRSGKIESDRRPPIDISQRPDVLDLRTLALPGLQQEKENNYSQPPMWRGALGSFSRDKGSQVEVGCSDGEPWRW